MTRPLHLLLVTALLAGAVPLTGSANGAANVVVPAAPAPAPAALRTFIAGYGPEADPLIVLEDGGRLYATGRGLDRVALVPDGRAAFRAGAAGPRLVFEHAGRPDATVTVGRQRLAAWDNGRGLRARIRGRIHVDFAAIRREALAATPPAEPPPAHASDLVELVRVVDGLKLDIRYATADNFMGVPVYERAAAFMQRDAALALGRAQAALARQGFGLLIHDAYRPWYVTKMFWDATPPEGHVFVADPAQGSRHNRGCAVDLTLYSLATGRVVEMTGGYDEMSKRSYTDYPGGTAHQRWLRGLLRSAMEAEGFTVYPEEWWHFDYRDWKQYGIGNETFDALAGRH
jgi:D-alanyl-D-alanine dipeptidase